MSIACTLRVTCSALDAPTIAEATLGLRSTQARARSAVERPASSASAETFATAVRTSSLIHREIMFLPPASSVARLPSGGASPGRYFPVSTPWASGDQTIWLMPSSSHVGTTSASMTRHNSEYCGWLDTSGTLSSSASAAAERIWSAVHSDTPRYATLPWWTRSANADIVTSSGVRWS